MRNFSKPYGMLRMLDFQNVYQNLPESMAAEIRALWVGEKAITDRAEIQKRLREVVYVILDSPAGKVAGVATAVKRKVKMLNENSFFEFRCYIGEKYRIAGLDVKLSKTTFDFLEQVSSQDPEKPIGIFSILENEELKQQPVWRRAVWPEIEMYLVGFTSAGNPIRVHYFKGVRI